MGYSGDFRIEHLCSGKLRVRDKFTNERIGDILLDDSDVKIVRRKNNGK